VRLLLDTHIFVWLASGRSRLSVAERVVLEAADELLVSLISIWELRIKWERSQAKAAAEQLITPAQALGFIDEGQVDLALLAGRDLATTLFPPIPYGDPFDEMLLVHAQRLGARLLTRDQNLVDHPLAYRA